jgi:2-succinyl-5-enolpyruvyl-6-hydroxy-3-cyclohexene-1-carboxylate synthase
MDLTNETFAPLRVMIDEFARAGVRHAVVAPGSRNAPIAYALGDCEELKTWSVLDERQAGFFALGIAKSTGLPVIVTCTSGSAAANLHPAVIEADHAGVPLIVLTADRPPELRDNGAGQAIDQIKLYGGSTRWFVEAGNHPVSDETLRHFRKLASRAVDAATGLNPGPIHINLPLREPLRPKPEPLGEVESTLGATGRGDRRRWSASAATLAADESLGDALAAAERPVFVVGEQNIQGFAAVLAAFAARTGAVVLADALSQLRRTELAQEATIVAAYDLILRSDTAKSQLAPDLIVRIGETPTSKPLRTWMAMHQCRQIVIDSRGRQLDPTRSATDHWQVDPAATIGATTATAAHAGSPSWRGLWTELEIAAQAAIDHSLAQESYPFEPAVYRSILKQLDAATIWVSSSMPIRDVEAVAPIGGDAVRFLANRGSNGIDGVVSSALGAIAPWNCDRVVLLTGDLAFLYDASALAIAKQNGLDITIVCVDNGGGGIFSFLPLAEHREHFEKMIATPPAVKVGDVATAYGLEVVSPTSEDELISAAEEPGLIHLKTSRQDNKLAHDRLAAHVLDSVTAVLADSGAFR